METREYGVLLHNKNYVESMLTRIAKRAARKGLPPITWSWGKPVTKLEEVPHPQYGRDVHYEARVTRVPLIIPIEVPHYRGWRFIATLQHLEGANIVRAIEGETVPPKYRNVGPVCEHCRMQRKRVDTFLLKHADGRIVQVGRSCLGDFLGSDEAGKLAAAASFIAEVKGVAEEGMFGEGSGGGSGGSLVVFLMTVAWAIRHGGWISKKAAAEASDRGEERTPTADTAWQLMFNAQARKEAGVELEPMDEKLAEDALAWAENLSDEEVNASSSDYLHNIRAIAQSGLVEWRTKGLAASIVAAYQRNMEQRAERERKRPSEWIGTVGDKVTVIGTLKSRRLFSGDYGYTTFLTFETPDGDIVQWKASGSQLDHDALDKTFAITGTIKAHSTWKDRKQTDLTRAKLEEVPEGTTSVTPPEKPKRAPRKAAAAADDLPSLAWNEVWAFQTLPELQSHIVELEEAVKSRLKTKAERSYFGRFHDVKMNGRVAIEAVAEGEFGRALRALDNARNLEPFGLRRGEYHLPDKPWVDEAHETFERILDAMVSETKRLMRSQVEAPPAPTTRASVPVPATSSTPATARGPQSLENYEAYKSSLLQISEGRLTFSQMAEKYTTLLVEVQYHLTVEQHVYFNPRASSTILSVKAAANFYSEGMYRKAMDKLADAWHMNPLKSTSENVQSKFYGLPAGAAWVGRANALMEELHEAMADKIQAAESGRFTPNAAVPCACRYVRNGEHDDGCFYDD